MAGRLIANPGRRRAAGLALVAVGLLAHAVVTREVAQRLGLRVNESALTGVRVSHVLRGGAAEQAGLAAGDELLALGDWRLRRLDDALRLLVDAVPAPLLVARDQRVLRLSLTLPAASQAVGAVALVLAENAKPAALALRKAWLGG